MAFPHLMARLPPSHPGWEVAVGSSHLDLLVYWLWARHEVSAAHVVMQEYLQEEVKRSIISLGKIPPPRWRIEIQGFTAGEAIHLAGAFTGG